MKQVRLLIIFVLIWVVVVFLLPGRVSKTYEFAHPAEDIVSIDLLLNTNESGKADESLLIFQKSLNENEIDSFIRCVQTGEKLPSHIDTNIIPAEMMGAIYESAEKGKEIVL